MSRLKFKKKYFAWLVAVLAVAVAIFLLVAAMDNNTFNQIDRDQIETAVSRIAIPSSLKFESDYYKGQTLERYLDIGGFTYWSYTYAPAAAVTPQAIRADLITVLQQAGYTVNPPQATDNGIFAHYENVDITIDIQSNGGAQADTVKQVVIQASRQLY